MNRKGFEFSFGWIFAIIVGAVILVLALYATNRLVSTERNVQDTEVAKQIDILLNPLSTGLEEGKTARITFPTNTRVYNDCTLKGVFGEQKISAATASQVGGEVWQDAGIATTSLNKYVFSSSIVEGRGLIIFSKPFVFPYKVGDLLFAWSDTERYCFVNPPLQIKEDLDQLKIKNIFLNNSRASCEKNTTVVCFAESGCAIDVSLQTNTVRKKGKTVEYTGELLYGAIFAEPEIYDCQVKRLLRRSAELADIYKSKSESLSPKGCSSALEGDLNNFAAASRGLKSLSELNGLEAEAKQIKEKNDNLICGLF